jgi:nitrous oxidase accessory protein NosD
MPDARPFGWMVAIASIVTAALSWAPPAAAATLEVGAGKTYPTPSAAAAVARDGDHIVIAAGEYFDCAIWHANNLVITGAGPDATVITDKTCGGKALFVLDGDNITIRGLTLTRARVPDGNGAGIRAEGGDLTIEHVRFVNNQDGILSAPLPQSSIIIRDSEFIRNGSCQDNGGCAHGVYVSTLKLLRIERTKFLETKQGHQIKSRAQRTEIIDCDIADGPNGTASYSIDIPNGGAVVVRGTRIEKGPKSENHEAGLIIGEEGVTQRTPEIVVEGNTFEVDGTYPSSLVKNETATEARLTHNKLIGATARALRGDGSVDGDTE